MADAFIYDAVRTPFGRYGGALAGVRPDDLATHVVRALEERGLDPERVDEVVFGAANQAGEDNRNVARMAVLLAGLVGVAEHDLVDARRVEPALRQRPHRVGRQVVRPDAGQRAAVAAERRAHRVVDERLSHVRSAPAARPAPRRSPAP